MFYQNKETKYIYFTTKLFQDQMIYLARKLKRSSIDFMSVDYSYDVGSEILKEEFEEITPKLFRATYTDESGESVKRDFKSPKTLFEFLAEHKNDDVVSEIVK